MKLMLNYLFNLNWESKLLEEDFNKPGIIKSILDGVALIYNIEDVMMGEILQVIGLGIKAVVISINEEGVKAIILAGEEKVKPGFQIERTKKLFKFPVTTELLGRVVNTYGEPIDYYKIFKYIKLI